MGLQSVAKNDNYLLNSTLKFSRRIRALMNMPDNNLSIAEIASPRCFDLIVERELEHFFTFNTCRSIHDHRCLLNKLLGRDVGFYVAALDYLENIEQSKGSKYVFVEEVRLKELIDQSMMDGLTQLYNHQASIMLLDKELEFARRKGKPLSLVMLDIDNFKTINDRLGHPHGDLVLSQVAGILRHCLRSMYVAGRYGGEEFMIFFPDTDCASAREIAERMRVHIESAFQHSELITVSMGLASFPDAEEADELIERADQALYSAKHNGKNQLCAHQQS